MTKITLAIWISRLLVHSEGVSALQMDIKIEGITEEIMRQALQQAKVGRLHILGEMDKALAAPRAGVVRLRSSPADD